MAAPARTAFCATAAKVGAPGRFEARVHDGLLVVRERSRPFGAGALLVLLGDVRPSISAMAVSARTSHSSAMAAFRLIFVSAACAVASARHCSAIILLAAARRGPLMMLKSRSVMTPVNSGALWQVPTPCSQYRRWGAHQNPRLLEKQCRMTRFLNNKHCGILTRTLRLPRRTDARDLTQRAMLRADSAVAADAF